MFTRYKKAENTLYMKKKFNYQKHERWKNIMSYLFGSCVGIKDLLWVFIKNWLNYELVLVCFPSVVTTRIIYYDALYFRDIVVKL